MPRLTREEIARRDSLRYEIAERRICWPDPDATCLEGGCGWCNDSTWIPLSRIERYAAKVSRTGRNLPNRGIGTQDAWDAYQCGLEHGFYNAETRASRAALLEYAETVPVEPLREMAHGMKGWHEARRPEVTAWLMRHRRQVLDDSFRITSEGRRR